MNAPYSNQQFSYTFSLGYHTSAGRLLETVLGWEKKYIEKVLIKYSHSYAVLITLKCNYNKVHFNEKLFTITVAERAMMETPAFCSHLFNKEHRIRSIWIAHSLPSVASAFDSCTWRWGICETIYKHSVKKVLLLGHNWIFRKLFTRTSTPSWWWSYWWKSIFAKKCGCGPYKDARNTFYYCYCFWDTYGWIFEMCKRGNKGYVLCIHRWSWCRSHICQSVAIL